MPDLRIHDIPGDPHAAGVAHGRQIRDLLAPAFRAAYLARLEPVTRCDRADLRTQAARWLDRLPELHTLHAGDDPPADRTSISWLFWAREALETCASLDELERFIAITGRDRGVFAIAGDGKTDEAAIFECSRAHHVRHDVDPARAACVTNHTLARDLGASRTTRTGGTIGRFRSLESALRARAPREGPADLIGLLSSSEVEMRTPRWMRTIYSAVVRPRDATVWFAAGGADGTPAASRGRWSEVRPPWAGG